MSGGLVADVSTTTGGPQTAAGAELAASQQGEGVPDYAPASGAEASHLDSFIESSGWTREDLQLLAMGVQTAILIYWIRVEVRR